MTIDKPTATCPYCGEKFTKLKDGKIPTHDFPKPCRSVCRGSGEQPKANDDTPLWKDDPTQQGRDFFEAARLELHLYGFAVVKQMAEFSGQNAGVTQCPLCGKQVKFSIAPSNRHCRARCETDECINAQE
jgi:uncharacterized Zn-finger protein